MRWIALLLLGLLTLPSLAAKVVTISSGEWPPWNSKELPGYGLASQIVTRAFTEAGYQTEYHFFPWAEAFDLAKQGKFDASISWGYSQQRAEFFDFSMPIFKTSIYWFYHADSPKKPYNWDDLTRNRPLIIGATKGYIYGDEFESLKGKSGIKIVYAGDDVTNLKKLLNREIDLFPSQLCVGYFLIRTELPQELMQFAHSPSPSAVFDHHLIFSKRNPQTPKLLQDFNQAMTSLTNKGVFRKMGKKCFRQWKSA
ncbi:substrate-binding periplasmic protein [Dongshaea marina]|uniref:substrate-binding periplasmic protein n=1 Tax=Dongshaea marina TaxID=2047966 RepID=UPI000D3E0B41|nr:transporter substrate-binding domain-containing protein [Dongshaea marina]